MLNRQWLVGNQLTMADIALAPYLNRLAALAIHGMWETGSYPRVAEWFERMLSRHVFRPALLDWVGHTS